MSTVNEITDEIRFKLYHEKKAELSKLSIFKFAKKKKLRKEMKMLVSSMEEGAFIEMSDWH